MAQVKPDGEVLAALRSWNNSRQEILGEPVATTLDFDLDLDQVTIGSQELTRRSSRAS